MPKNTDTGFDKNRVHVRLHPLDKKRGYHAQRYGCFGHIFEIDRWYKVRPEQAEYLAEVRYEPENEDSKLIFQAMSVEEADKTYQKELRAAAQAGRNMPQRRTYRDLTSRKPRDIEPAPPPAASEESGDITTADLAQGTSRARAPGRRKAG